MMEVAAPVPDEKPLKRSSSFGFMPPFMSELSSFGNFMLGETIFTKTSESFLTVSGSFEDQTFAAINTSDLLFTTDDNLTELRRGCGKETRMRNEESEQ